MKNLRTLDRRRIRSAIGWGDETCGSFIIASPIDDAPMYVIASQGGAWDHVSVSRRNRCPNWPEMDHVRKLFFEACETVMQLHVPSEENINNHPNCLHLLASAECRDSTPALLDGRAKGWGDD